jgi:hypothetical protein
MGKIVTKSIKKIYKSLIKQVVKDLGEQISLYYDPDIEKCPNCYTDPVSGKSKNVFCSSFVTPVIIFGETISPHSFTRGRCPVCKGDGSLYDYTPVSVKAIVKWDRRDSDMERTVAGDEGRNVARIKAQKSYYVKIRDCAYAIIDGVKCVLIKPPVLRGLGAADEIVVAFFQATAPGKSIKE